MRLFTGLSLAPTVVDQMYDLLRPFIPRIRLQWSPPENFHLTTKFLGEWPEEKLKLVVDALERMRKPGPFSVEVERLGLFPNPYSPRVLWAGVRAPQALAQLAHDTDEALAEVGVPREKRAYTPHLTLARIRPDSPLKQVRALLEANAAACFGLSEARDFHLYLSRPAPGGSKYEKLVTFAL
jgi:2'-5' RNA ligase